MKNEHIDLSLLPDQPQLQDYQQKPVQNYGMSLLRGMGFTQAKGIGKQKDNQLADIYVLKPRPKGLGLGAELPQQPIIHKLQVGDRVLIVQEPHKGIVGFIHQKIDQDWLYVQLYPSKSVVKVLKKCVKKISKSEMKKLQQQLTQQKNDEKSKKKLKWVVPQIRVKVIDPKSELYLKKLIISDLLSNKLFECKDQSQNNKTIANLSQKDIQTVIPKPGGLVIIVKGLYKGQKATLMDRKKSKGVVTVRTQDQLQIVEVGEDDVAQFVEL